jgi:hypothetical protein
MTAVVGALLVRATATVEADGPLGEAQPLVVAPTTTAPSATTQRDTPTVM